MTHEDKRLQDFRCQHDSGECLVGYHINGLPHFYYVDGEKLMYRDVEKHEEIGDLTEHTVESLVCQWHCYKRYLKMMGAHDPEAEEEKQEKKKKPGHKVIGKAKKKEPVGESDPHEF